VESVTLATPYEILGISADSDDETVTAAFRKAVKEYHPDLNGGNRAAERRFRRVLAARDILANPERRSFYDRNQGRRWQLGERTSATVIVCAFVGVLLVSHLLSQDPMQVSLLDAPPIEIETTTQIESDDMPDAVAEIKALRDLQEDVISSRESGGVLASSERHASRPKISRALRGIAVCWRRLATKIRTFKHGRICFHSTRLVARARVAA
jgi:curved DNA-binding protein CbpA